MKNKMRHSIFTGFFLGLLFSAGAAFSQCTTIVLPDNPEMKAKAEESKVLYEDAIRSGQQAELKKAVAPYTWMLTNVPNHHISLYIQGIDLYDKLATLEKDKAKKKVYVDSLMIIYDLRIKFCGDEAAVTNRKANSFLKFNANEKPAESLALLDKALELNGNNISDGTLTPYMQVIKINYVNLKKMTDDEVMQRYDKLVAIADAKIQDAQSKGKPVEKLQKTKLDMEKVLLETIKVTCDIVRTKYGPKWKANPKDMEIAKKIFTFMLKEKCTDDPLWLEAAEAMHANPEEEKNCGLAKNLGIIYLAKENYEKAEKYLTESQSICTEAGDKAEIMLYLGGIEAKKGNRSGARDMYRQAAAADPSLSKQVSEKIGDLYFQSYEGCKKLTSKVQDRLVFLIAYDYYAKGGDKAKMAAAKENFPSKEEIFTENVSLGANVKVECWINESTTIRTRD
jgi:tetratricopeptide (TPR) repeat protein